MGAHFEGLSKWDAVLYFLKYKFIKCDNIMKNLGWLKNVASSGKTNNLNELFRGGNQNIQLNYHSKFCIICIIDFVISSKGQCPQVR